MEQLNLWVAGHPAEVFYMLLVGSLLINRLPFAGVFFRTVNTLLHESGHALGAILTSGEVVRVEFKKDTSGIAETKSSSKFRAFIVSFAGYPFAALVSSILLVLVINEQLKPALFILFTFIVLNLMFFVRNLFGIVWLLVFASMLTFIVWFDNVLLSRILLLFIALIAFTETLTSTLFIAFLGFTKPKKAGDLSNMQKVSGIPSGFWAILMVSVVGWILWYTASHYFPVISL